MKLRIDNWYKSDKGKCFILTEKGKQACANYKHQTIMKQKSQNMILIMNILRK